MSRTLQLLSQGITAERLKHQHTFFFGFLFLVPLAVSLISFLFTLYEPELDFANPWRWYIAFNYRTYLHIFLVLQVLLVSQLNYLEHKNNTWKNLRALPLPRWVFFSSKLLFGWIVLLMNYAFFYGLVMGSGFWLAQLRPELGFQHTSYWYEALIPVIKSFLASFAVVAIMYWVSYQLKSLLWSFISGLLGYGSAFALLLHNSRPTYRGLPFSQYHPFSFSGHAFQSFGTGNHLIQMEQVYYGVMGGILIALMHYLTNQPKMFLVGNVLLRSTLLLALGCLTLLGCGEENTGQHGYKYSVASWQGVQVSDPRYKHAIEKSRKLLLEANRHHGLPGAQIAVALDGKVCWSENFGFANLQQGSVVKSNTLFRIASVSKLFTAAAVARLVQEKRLNLDTPIIHYLPELPPHYAGITTRHLVSHQAGIRHYYGADSPEKTEHYPSIQEALNGFIQAPLLFPPGTDWAYSSYGWVLVSAVVERVSGKPFLGYMQEAIWKPLGLGNTFGEILPHRKQDLTTFYTKDHPQGDWREAPYEDMSFKWASGGFTSNANDLVRFGTALLDGKFLTEETVRLMFSPQVTITGDTTGFGIGVVIYTTQDQRRIVGHGSFMPTARSYLLLFPEDKLVIAFTANTAMTNFSDENLQDMAALFINQKSDENYFSFDPTLYNRWKGVWRAEMENATGSFDKVYLHFYQVKNGLGGMIFFENQAPSFLEIIHLQADSMRVLAALPAYTTVMDLSLKGSKLTGISVFNKPLSPLLKRRLREDGDLLEMLAPKHLSKGEKVQ